MNLARLFLVNAVFTLAGGAILLLAPDQLMRLVGMHFAPSAYVIYYLLGASSLSFAVLSVYGTALKDTQALRAVAVTCLVFHASAAGVAAYAFAAGLSAAVWANIAVHVLFSLLFLYYGVMRPPKNVS